MKKRKKKILILIIVIFTTIVGFSSYLLLPKTWQTTIVSREDNNIPQYNKKIVADITQMKIGLYEDKILKEYFPISQEDRPLIYLNSGKYSPSYITSLKLDKKIIDFSNEATEFFVLNSEDEKYTGLDEENLYFLKNNKSSFPKLSATAFMIADINNGAIIYEKNKNKSMPIASLSKLTTAIVAMEEMEQNKYITITKEMLSAGYGDYGSLRRGEQLKVNELLYPLLLSSSNDASFVLAMDYGKEDFTSKMNEKVSSLDMKETFYEEPSGISENNVSSAEDLFKLSQYIYQNKKWIFDITSLKSVNSWRNSNYFAGDKGYLGGKNGYTDEAMETAVNLFSIPLSSPENRELAIVLLHSNDRENDSLKILKWLKENVAYRGDIKPDQEFSAEETDYFAKSLKTISLSFVGNIIIGSDTKESVLANGGNFSFLFNQIESLKNDDITFGNINGPISDTGAPINKNSSPRMHPLIIKSLSENGLDVLSVANNNIGDWGENAFKDTLARLKSEKLLPAGGGIEVEEATIPAIFEKEKVKIGFLSFSNNGPKWLKADIGKAGILMVDDLFAKRIKNASSKTDILAVAISYGEATKEKQTELAKIAIDNGAKIVVGYGQEKPSEEIENYKDGIIVYSLGNFISDNLSLVGNDGIILEVSASGNGVIKKTKIKKVKINKFYQPEIN